MKKGFLWLLTLCMVLSMAGVPAGAEDAETCTHEDTYITYAMEPGTVEYVEIEGDNYYHIEKFYGAERVHCIDCGKLLSEGEWKNYELEWSHNYNDDGVCNDCGHVNTCTHANAYSYYGFDSDAVYTSIDNRDHKVAGGATEYTYCDDCGIYVSKVHVDNYERTESHNYDNDGVCDLCGHINTCTHTNTYSYYRFDSDAVYTSIDNRNHKVAGGATKYTYCEDCGICVSKVHVDNYERTENHDYDNDGVCINCGHVNTCTHEKHTVSSWFNDYEEGLTYTSLNTKQHQVTGKGTKNTSCAECGITLKSEKNVDLTEIWSHDYENGVCTQCGHVNTCKHTGSKSVSTWYEGDVKYVDDNNGVTHTKTGSGNLVTYCDNCGETLEKKPFTNLVLKESHNYDGSKCLNCGHVRSEYVDCKHENVETYSYVHYSSDKTYESVDDKYHNETGLECVGKICMDCGAYLGDELTGNTITETSYHSYVDGKCTDCGHVNACEHKHTRSYGNIVSSESVQPISAAQHRVTGIGEVHVYCNDCGMHLSTKVVPDSTWEEDHDYMDGVCTKCGYESSCEHKNAEKKNGVYSTSKIEQGDKNGHLLTGLGYTYYYCPDCHASFNYEYPEDGKETTITVCAEHQYIDNECVTCGYINGTALITNFVNRCYSLILNRGADPAGLESWVTQLENKTKTASEIIYGFMYSGEFTGRNLSHGDAVEILYQTMLNRGSDAGGKEMWVNNLSDGYDYVDIINGFCGSGEFKGLCETYGIEPGSVVLDNDDDKVAAFVKRCYRLILKRGADEAGLNTWVTNLKSGTKTASEIIYGFMYSSEYTGRGMSNSATVEILYRVMLNRGSDAGGKASWLERLSNGENVVAIINGFCGSQEFIALCKEYGIEPGSVKTEEATALNKAVKAEKKTPEAKAEVVELAPVETEDLLGEAVQESVMNEEKAKEFVVRCYKAALDREANEAELADWVDQIVTGEKTPEKIVRGFLLSEEFRARNLSSEETVKILYRIYMNREADPEGLAFWTVQLEDGVSLVAVVKEFAASEEFKAILKNMKN